LEAPLEETIDGLDSSSDEETDEEDSCTDNLQGAMSTVATQPPCMSSHNISHLCMLLFQLLPVMMLVKAYSLLE